MSKMSRRDFLKDAAVASVGMGILASGLTRTAAAEGSEPAQAAAPQSVVATTVPNEPVTFSSGIKLRWYNNAGFEVVLPSGRHLLVDPWLDSAGYWVFPADQIERVDYVLLSHIHSDHAADCKTLQDKFGRFVLMVPDLSIEALMLDQDLDIRNIYRVNDGRKYEFDDVIIEVYGSRHTESNSLKSWRLQNGEAGFHEFVTSADYGTLDVVNYVITSKADGTKIIVWAGMTTEDQKYALKDTHADIAIVHISPKQDMDLMGQMIAAWGPKVVLPHHYDIWDTEGGISWKMHKASVTPEQFERYLPAVEPEGPASGFNTALYMADQGAAVKKYAPNSDFLMIEHQKWYRFGTYYALLDE